MPLAFLAFVAASNDANALTDFRRRLVGQNLHYVSDQCEGNGGIQAPGQGTCTEHIDDWELKVGNRPSGHTVSNYRIATRCCSGSGNTFSCASSGPSGCYGGSNTRDEAEDACATDGKRPVSYTHLTLPTIYSV